MVKRSVYITGESDHVVEFPSSSKLLSIDGYSQLTWSSVLDRQENQSVLIDGQTTFYLNYEPLDENTVIMFINGIKQTYGSEYIVAENGTVGYFGSYPPILLTTDSVEFWYIIK